MASVVTNGYDIAWILADGHVRRNTDIPWRQTGGVYAAPGKFFTISIEETHGLHSAVYLLRWR